MSQMESDPMRESELSNTHVIVNETEVGVLSLEVEKSSDFVASPPNVDTRDIKAVGEPVLIVTIDSKVMQHTASMRIAEKCIRIWCRKIGRSR